MTATSKVLAFVLKAATTTGTEYLGLCTESGQVTFYWTPIQSSTPYRQHLEMPPSEAIAALRSKYAEMVGTGCYSTTLTVVTELPTNIIGTMNAARLVRSSSKLLARNLEEAAREFQGGEGRGVGRPSQTRSLPSATPLPCDLDEEFFRPNGERYLPRALGDHQDVAVLRAFRRLPTPVNVLLVGPSGSGKTGLAEAAHAPELITISGHGDLTVDRIVGKLDPDGDGGWQFVEGPLIQAMKRGCVLLIDEINKLPHEIISIFHSVSDGRGLLTVDDRPADPIVKAVPGFALIGTLNPDELGSNGLPEAITSRFSVSVHVSTDHAAAAALGVPEEFITVAANLQTRNTDPDRHPVWVPQMRELLAAKSLTDAGLGLTFAAQAMLGACPRPEDVPEVAEVMRQVLGVSIGVLELGPQL